MPKETEWRFFKVKKEWHINIANWFGKIVNTGSELFDFRENRHLSKQQLCQVGTFPVDYNFSNVAFKYLIGMSVPPVMVAQIATKIHEQWQNIFTNPLK